MKRGGIWKLKTKKMHRAAKTGQRAGNGDFGSDAFRMVPIGAFGKGVKERDANPVKGK